MTTHEPAGARQAQASADRNRFAGSPQRIEVARIASIGRQMHRRVRATLLIIVMLFAAGWLIDVASRRIRPAADPSPSSAPDGAWSVLYGMHEYSWLVTLLAVASMIVVIEWMLWNNRRSLRTLVRIFREQQHLALVAQRTTNLVMLTDAEQRIEWVNESFERVTGFGVNEARRRRPSELLIDAKTDADRLAHLRQTMTRPGGGRAQLLHHTRDGRSLWLDVNVQPLRDEDGTLTGFVNVASDITELLHARDELRLAAIAFDSLEAIIIADPEFRVLRVNPAFTRITGYESPEVIGQRFDEVVFAAIPDRTFHDSVHAALASERHWTGEIRHRRKNGETCSLWVSITIVEDDSAAVRNYVVLFSDITRQREADRMIYRLAHYDPLTDLPNRRLLREKLHRATIGSAASGSYCAILFIDLDRFKIINDTRGHETGDRVLVEVARRLTSGVRAIDTVSRQGGDEFVIIVRNLAPEEGQAKDRIERIVADLRAALNQPYVIDGQVYHLTSSIGIHLFDGRVDNVDKLLERADIAMYQAKRGGRDRTAFFDFDLHVAMTERAALDVDLRRAVPDRQLRLVFQPQVDAQGAIIGAEVLLRWQHPLRGLIAPASFIPVAEDSDLILEIGEWVLRESCIQLAAWAQSPLHRSLQLSVNVSPRQFRYPDFIDRVHAVLRGTGIRPGRLKLELTEDLVVRDIDDAVRKMESIRALGVGFSLDDFGTGHSSLSYLVRLPLDQLKIDRSFMHELGSAHNNTVVVQTIINMARSLSMDVIAEGVETEEQFGLLSAWGCCHYQGFLFGAPMTPGEFDRRLRIGTLETRP